MFFKRTKNVREPQPLEGVEPSYIARDATFEGNITCDGEIHIDGAVRGSVRAETCLVDAHGEIHGEVAAQVVYVRGRVLGPITGTHVHIHAGAHVEGNVTNETISIENGAYVYGSIRHGGSIVHHAPVPAPVPMPKPQFNNIELAPSPAPADELMDNVRPLKTSVPRPAK
jgi:cytoskeletal protein CcmA (bactofilin family)